MIHNSLICLRIKIRVKGFGWTTIFIVFANVLADKLSRACLKYLIMVLNYRKKTDFKKVRLMGNLDKICEGMSCKMQVENKNLYVVLLSGKKGEILISF